tara:strand:+ start:751 stop:1515 length:765 start_codon:yes stop_codon:yes gene_type:complete
MGFFSTEKWQDDKNKEEQRKKWLEISDEERSKEIENLNTIDYTLLESERSENLLLCLHLGLFEMLDSTEKLYRLGLIKKLDRKLTFSEKEKLERQKDTPQFKQYAARIQRIMDSEAEQRIREYQVNLALKNLDDPMDITEKGKEILEKKRKDLKSHWLEVQSSYDKNDKQQFRKTIESNLGMFPLFFIMGLTNGAMMEHMMNKMEMNLQTYMQDAQIMGYDQGYADAGGDSGGGFSDGGGDSGGFLDGGFQPGF